MKTLIIGTAISLAMVAGASAADLPPARAPAPVYSKAPPPAWSWTGCYIGANVGGGWTGMSASDTSGYTYGSFNGAGVVGGGQVGCDYQVGAFVFGVQGLFDGTGINGSGTSPDGRFANSSTIPWLATATGRIGFAVMPTTLVYAKGGAAWVRDSISTTTVATGAPLTSTSYTPSGWTVGGGLEHMFMPHWSVFVEYDYVGFGTQTPTFSPAPLNAIGVSQNVQMGIVGVNFRF
jgi:outer membrane immunogenic protein